MTSIFSNSTKLLFRFVFLSCIICLTNQSEIQHVEFFNDANCETSIGTVWKTIEEKNENGYRNAKSFRVNGVWEIGQCKEVGSGSVIALEGATFISGWECSNSLRLYSPEECHKVDFENFILAKKYGNSDLTVDEISLYTDKNLSGYKFTTSISGNYELILQQPTVIRSWLFTGSNEWSLYSATNFTNKLTCLSPNAKTKSVGHGIAQDFQSNFLIGSVRRGCKNDSRIVKNDSRIVSPSVLTIVTILVHLFT